MAFDNLCKYLRQCFQDDFSLWLLGQTFPFAEIQSSELMVDPIRADSVVLESPTLILHLEFQTVPKPDIAFRMADYALRLQRRYPDPIIQIRQIVIYLKQTGSPLAQVSAYQRGSLVHEFEVIRLWEQDPEQLAGLTGLLPLVVLTDPQHGEERLRQVAGEIERIVDEGVRADIAAATAVLAGIALNKELVKRILGEMTMRESAIYQEWRQEALAEGIQLGKQEGIQIGEERTKQQTARHLLAMGLDPQQIAMATELTLEQVQQLQQEYEDPQELL
ncbi:MAG: Rpn family recombination-promoting nuclease/putative transposase [Cyanobacteriota bacterium]|nr:Rpn family recombination-promoting nuclease/putative transposase [Cyanobacteriota bacterium]